MDGKSPKCTGCAVPLNVGAHTFELDGKPWHCACLLRYQRSEIDVLHKRIDELKAKLASQESR